MENIKHPQYSEEDPIIRQALMSKFSRKSSIIKGGGLKNADNGAPRRAIVLDVSVDPNTGEVRHRIGFAFRLEIPYL